jgi:hypothetical protein
MSEQYGTLWVVTQNADGSRRSNMCRTSINPSEDDTLIYKALEFRDAARRDGRVFVCALVPRWKAPLLRLLGIGEHK